MLKRMVLVAAVALLLLPLAACTVQPTPTPAPTQAATKAPTAAATPPPTKAPEVKPTKPHEEVKITLLAMTLGGSAYVMSFALGEIINKTHPWLRVSVLETKGSVANLTSLAMEPAIRKNTFIFTHEESNSWAREGKPPFTQPYKGARAIASMAETTLIFATLNKNIKTKADVDGKRVMTMQKGTSTAVIHETLLNDVWGIKPKISNGTFESIKDALKDGLIDVGTQPINGVPGIGYFPVPSLDELMSTTDVYFVNIPAADVAAVAKKGGFDIYPHTIPARGIGDKQPEAVGGYAHSLSWWADAEMSDEIVYEITKTIYENADKFKEYHRDGVMITQKTMARIGTAEELFHAGALKFYKEKGIKPGVS